MALTSSATHLFLHIQDAESGESLSFVNVKYTCNNKDTLYTKSNIGGIVELKAICYPVSVSVSYIGYQATSIRIQASDVVKKHNNEYFVLPLKKSTLNVNQVVVTGQAVPILASQSIYKVNTITAAQIQQKGAVTLNDVLSLELNQFVSNDNVLGSSVNIGGIGGQNVKILVNGVPVIGRENGNVDLGQLNLHNVKRVEMVQGPMSVMYGTNALGGVINLITSTPQKPITFSLRSYLESVGRYNISGNLGFSKKNHNAQITLARNFFQGWTPDADTSIDRFMLWKPKRQYTADASYDYQYKKFKFNYNASYLNEKISNKGEPIISPYEGYAFDEYYKTNRVINTVGSTITLNEKEQLQLLNSFSTYIRTKNRYKKDLVSLDESLTPNVGDQDTSIFNNLNLRGTLTSSRLKNTNFMLGYEYNFETGDSYKLADKKQTMSDLGLYSSVKYSYKGLQLQPSLRYTLNSKFSRAITPALHTHLILKQKTHIRASYARGFRSPSLKEMYLQFIDQNHTIIGNPDLNPEVADHLELGLEHELKLGKGNLVLSYNSYYNAIQNMIALAIYNNHAILRKYLNIDYYENWINNAQVKYMSKNIQATVGVGNIRVPELTQVPKHSIWEYNTAVSFFIKPINTSLNINYKYNNTQPIVTLDNKYVFTDPVHIANVSIQRRFLKEKLMAQCGIRNLFNLQSTTLNGVSGTGAHTSSSGMQLFPERSIFISLIYNN